MEFGFPAGTWMDIAIRSIAFSWNARVDPSLFVCLPLVTVGLLLAFRSFSLAAGLRPALRQPSRRKVRGAQDAAQVLPAEGATMLLRSCASSAVRKPSAARMLWCGLHETARLTRKAFPRAA